MGVRYPASSMDNINNGESPSVPGTHAGPTQTIHDQLSSSIPVEMTTFDRQETAEDEPSLVVPAPSNGVSSSTSEGGITRNVERDSQQDDGKMPSTPSPKIHTQVPPPSASSNPPVSPTLSSTAPLNREQTAPAIGPSSDKPTQTPKESDSLGPVLTITLLLTNGARHPYKIDGKYLKKRNVSVDDDNPVNMSTYTLKELIWREWRDGEELPFSYMKHQKFLY